MNKRIKKKKQKAAYKIPKQIIRLARRWTELDSEIVFMADFRDIENGHYPKKLVENCVRKYKRINDFLINIESDSILRSGFIICHSAYGDEQFDGEYCDQSCGYSEDDYHGVYYYPIGENLYFAYNYDC
ncbi:hypothetical protein HO621_05480 [Streptococcus suis]|uniref:Uncharacterized protein n=1 Tax=Streptococcus suis TaxID=1307 RepID=A0A116KPV4_STRSU|nr:hypothetical protein [Streptococcus suis]NQH92509.1 hypothetical protein [Streptococcus suis]NQI12261.1 hypothetical protein [Streptococcus suis]NQO28189.1 hypothetical protein [Streptococcus suis]CYU26567.1 Uncharacterised protein [Streptococcus suis]CYU49470.1 Uncharacterised protein [Streptococcus suis]